jgi:hypothetical protein
MVLNFIKIFILISLSLFILLLFEGLLGGKLKILFHKLTLLNLPFYISFLFVSFFITTILNYLRIICCNR